MKTLITTMAVLFTMVTAANAGALERLANEPAKYSKLATCMLGASIMSHSDELGLSPKDIYDALTFPGNEDTLKMVVEYSDSQAEKIRGLRNYGADVNTVLDLMQKPNYSYEMYMTECVIEYYGVEA